MPSILNAMFLIVLWLTLWAGDCTGGIITRTVTNAGHHIAASPGLPSQYPPSGATPDGGLALTATFDCYSETDPPLHECCRRGDTTGCNVKGVCFDRGYCSSGCPAHTSYSASSTVSFVCASADFCVESVRTHGASIQNIYWSCFGAHYEEPTRVSSRTSTTEPIPVFPGLPGSQQTPPVPIGKQPAVEPFPAAVTPKPKASGKEPLSLSSVSDGDSTHQNDGNGPQVIPDPTLPLPSSDGFGEQTTSSMDTPPAGLPTDQDTAAIPMGNPGPWTTPSQAAPTPNADTSAGSTVAASSSSHLEPTISASGVPLRSPVPKPTAATSGDPQPTTMATQITAASPSGAPNTILPTFLSMPDNNLPPTPPMATALAASTAMDANGPSKGPLIGGILTGLVVVITLTATCLVYLYRGKRKQHREEEAAARAEAAAAAAAAAEQARPVLSRSHASSSASSAVSNSISEFQIQQATAVRYQRCGPHAPGRQVQLSWSGGGGIGQAQRTTKSLETATRSAATPEEDLSSRGGH